MKLLAHFRNWLKKDTADTAHIARERLQIIVAHHKNHQPSDDKAQMITQLKQEILSVLSKYYPSADFSNINVQLERDDQQSMLQIDLTIPDQEDSV